MSTAEHFRQRVADAAREAAEYSDLRSAQQAYLLGRYDVLLELTIARIAELENK